MIVTPDAPVSRPAAAAACNAAGIAAASPVMTDEDHHFARGDRAAKWRRIAKHLRRHPADLSIALENLDRWEALGRVHPAPIREWRSRILPARDSPEGLRALLDFLEAPNHDSEPLKSCSPFVGLPLDADPAPQP